MSKFSWLHVKILSNYINPASYAQNLGVTLDTDFNFHGTLTAQSNPATTYLLTYPGLLPFVRGASTSVWAGWLRHRLHHPVHPGAAI